MGAFTAVVLTVVSSGGSAVGKAMQKQGTRTLPRLRLDGGVLREYLRCRPWVAGISLDVAGALLMVAAVAQAPVSLIQPISGVGLVILALYSHLFLGERLNRREWRAAAAALVGTALLGATSPPDASPPPPPAARAVSVILACSALALGLPSVVAALSKRIGWRSKKGGLGKGSSHSSSPPLRNGGSSNGCDKSSSSSSTSSSTSTFHHRSNSSSLQQTISYSLQSRPKTPVLVGAKAGAGTTATTETILNFSPPSASLVSLPTTGGGTANNELNRPWPPGLGLRAGLVFGLSTTACRAGFALAPAAAEAAATAAILLAEASSSSEALDDESVAAAASTAAASAASLSRLLGLAASAALSAAGLALQTAGLKDGNSVAVCTCASVASMLAGVASGAWALAEPVLRPGGGLWGAASRVFAMGLTVWGVAALAGAGGGGSGSGGGGGSGEGSGAAAEENQGVSGFFTFAFFRPLAAAATGKVLPKNARRVLLPPGARQALRKFEAEAARVPLLPTSACATPEKCKN